MKKLTTLVSAAALVAGMTVAASAQQAKVNETPTQGLGGQGGGLILPPPVLAAVVAAVVIGTAGGSSGTTN